MTRACCALCGAENRIGRVYVAMQSLRPNLVAIACTGCGRVSSQLRGVGHYVGFASIYACATTVLLLAGVLLAPDVDVTWTALVAATLPFLVLPAWWATRNAAAFAAAAPQPELGVAAKLALLTLAIAVITPIVGGAFYAFLVLR